MRRSGRSAAWGGARTDGAVRCGAFADCEPEDQLAGVLFLPPGERDRVAGSGRACKADAESELRHPLLGLRAGLLLHRGRGLARR